MAVAEHTRPAVAIDRLPTLTEVLELGRQPAPTEPEPLPEPLPDPSPAFDLAWPDAAPSADAPVVLGIAEPLAEPLAEPFVAPCAEAPAASPAEPAIDRIDGPSLVSQVLAEVQPLLGESLETRLRHALAPALASVADGLIRDARQELAGTLRDLVEQAVARAIRARRPPT